MYKQKRNFSLFAFMFSLKSCIFAPTIAIVAQLVELWLPKPKVAGSSPVYRSIAFKEKKKPTKRGLLLFVSF